MRGRYIYIYYKYMIYIIEKLGNCLCYKRIYERSRFVIRFLVLFIGVKTEFIEFFKVEFIIRILGICVLLREVYMENDLRLFLFENYSDRCFLIF